MVAATFRLRKEKQVQAEACSYLQISKAKLCYYN